MQYIVARPFREGEVDLKPGDTVDAGSWPNRPLLVAQRYLREIPDGVVPSKQIAAGARRNA